MERCSIIRLTAAMGSFINSRKERTARMYSSSREEEKRLFGGEKNSLVRESIGSAVFSEGGGCVG